MTKDPTNFREYAGTLISVIVISCYLAIGFLQMVITVWHGVPVTVPSDWNTTMQSLANIALGYLIGKQTVAPGATTTTVTPATVTTTIAPTSSDDVQTAK